MKRILTSIVWGFAATAAIVPSASAEFKELQVDFEIGSYFSDPQTSDRFAMNRVVIGAEYGLTERFSVSPHVSLVRESGLGAGFRTFFDSLFGGGTDGEGSASNVGGRGLGIQANYALIQNGNFNVDAAFDYTRYDLSYERAGTEISFSDDRMNLGLNAEWLIRDRFVLRLGLGSDQGGERSSTTLSIGTSYLF